ncbi:hypothetical protein D9611_013772 [Ephemerocybe angulata]|uniref:DUF4246 domain-containing protein n=1 Tax=Ephemerocybe angulata TaxID=980116 RepID=A0A8H5C4B1_9AGAR|nr:hypothetical protein D9611_013772 [Tulosesus angulatus]
MTAQMFTYCIKELQYRAEHFPTSPRGAIQVFPGDVWKSDFAVAESTRLSLLECVRPLEDVPEHKKDWHPNETVLDLVDPSLYPLVYGASRVLPLGATATTLDDCVSRCGEGKVIRRSTRLDYDGEYDPYWELELRFRYYYSPYSADFQWLPCEVDISGERPRILTYINNLHPKHYRDLYTVMEDVIAAAIPLWERTLAPLNGPFTLPRRIEYTHAKFFPEYTNKEHIRLVKEAGDAYPEGLEALKCGVDSDEWYEWCKNARRAIQPEPGEFAPLKVPKDWSLKERHGVRKPLQIIVKLVNIELTPEKPKYEGGTWHVEGKKNEAICAIAIYCYSCENITTSRLSFRQQSKSPEYYDISYERGYHQWLPDVFGVDSNGGTVQVLGSVVAKEGRLITFPNILQHKDQPFELADTTKPGHRKILALFLVDPYTSVISTADVPPQRLDWWAEEVNSATGNDPQANVFAKLPNELRGTVYSEVEDFPIKMNRAKKYREKLMEERSYFVLAHQEMFEATVISL